MMDKNVYGRKENGWNTPKKILVFYYIRRHYLKMHNLKKLHTWKLKELEDHHWILILYYHTLNVVQYLKKKRACLTYYHVFHGFYKHIRTSEDIKNTIVDENYISDYENTTEYEKSTSNYNQEMWYCVDQKTRSIQSNC